VSTNSTTTALFVHRAEQSGFASITNGMSLVNPWDIAIDCKAVGDSMARRNSERSRKGKGKSTKQGRDKGKRRHPSQPRDVEAREVRPREIKLKEADPEKIRVAVPGAVQAKAPARGGPEGFLQRIGLKAGKPQEERRGGRDRRDRRESPPIRDNKERSPQRELEPKRNKFDKKFDKRDKRSGKGLDKGRDKGRGRSRSKEKGGAVEVHGEVQKNSRGFAFLLHKPEDIFIPPNFAAKLLTGDVVKATIVARTKEILSLETVKRAIKGFIGTYEAGFTERFVVLADRTMREEVLIKEPPAIAGLRHGDKVLVEITKYEPRLEGRVTQSFGPTLAPKYDTLAVVTRSQWPQEFSDEVKEEAAKLSKEIQEEAAKSGYKGRKDLREKPFVTIDGKDARDFDDAVLVEKTASGYVLYVAIADVSEFVRPGMKLDDEAYGRATSVYFPEWVIPMLPESLSNGACSLRPDEEKLTLTCEMHFDINGKKRSERVYESVIRSHRRCIYEDVDVEAKAGKEFWKIPYELYRLIRESRNRRGSLDLDLPESKVVLDENSDTIDIKKVERVDAHRLIEEFMIAANEAVTELMEREGWPFIYRIHEPPQSEALQRFERFALALGLKPKLGDGRDPKMFANFITTLKEHPFASVLYYLMLRSLKQARYDPVNLKHFGLASQAYTHFTSPIRRYPDLMVHRLLKRFVRHENFESDAELQEFEDYLIESCDHCSKQERKAETLDRQVTKVKKSRFMAKHMGEEFDARITNVSDAGIYVELLTYFVDGLVPVGELEGDYFEFVEDRLMLVGKRTGKKYRIGDPVRVSVLRTDVDNGFIDFTLSENLIAENLEE